MPNAWPVGAALSCPMDTHTENENACCVPGLIHQTHTSNSMAGEQHGWGGPQERRSPSSQPPGGPLPFIALSSGHGAPTSTLQRPATSKCSPPFFAPLTPHPHPTLPHPAPPYWATLPRPHQSPGRTRCQTCTGTAEPRSALRIHAPWVPSCKEETRICNHIAGAGCHRQPLALVHAGTEPPPHAMPSGKGHMTWQLTWHPP